MEAKEEEFIVTQEWLEKMGAREAALEVFNLHYPNSEGVKASEVVKKCAGFGYLDFVVWLIDNLPFNKEAPELGQEYFYLYIERNPGYSLFKWEGKALEKIWLALHRVFPTKEDVERASEFVKDFFISHKEQLNYLTSEPEAGTKVWFDMDVIPAFGITSIDFDPKNELHQRLSKQYWFYKTCEDIIKAAILITEALEEEYKKAH